jgi:hypothetical protein
MPFRAVPRLDAPCLVSPCLDFNIFMIDSMPSLALTGHA